SSSTSRPEIRSSLVSRARSVLVRPRAEPTAQLRSLSRSCEHPRRLLGAARVAFGRIDPSRGAHLQSARRETWLNSSGGPVLDVAAIAIDPGYRRHPLHHIPSTGYRREPL